MTTFFLIVFALECVALLVWGLWRRGMIYTYPFLAAATFLGFVLVQLIGLRNDHTLPPGGLAKTALMSVLCLGMCYLGWVCCRRPMRALAWSYSPDRLLWVSAAYVAFGAYFFFMISRLPEELTSMGEWTGLPVAYLFFAHVLSYGFAVAVFLFARRPAWPALAVAAAAALFYLDRILLAGRRGVSLEFIFVILCACWFVRRVAVPRAVMLAGVLAGTLALYSIGDYRHIATQPAGPTWEAFSEIPFLQNLMVTATEGSEELRNAVYMIEATDRTGNFDWGLFHWNIFVFNYVPGQLVGPEVKASLTVPLPDDALNVLGYKAHTGSTVTGMTDCFQSFWYLGCLKFFVIAYILRLVYEAALRGHLAAQLFYALMIPYAMHAVTHQTHIFFSPWLHLAVFLIPGLLIARRAQAAPGGQPALGGAAAAGKPVWQGVR